MAPITDDIVNGLKSLVEKLEARVGELEAKLHGENGSSSGSSATTTTPGGMRMVIMGPPGAGETFCIMWLKYWGTDYGGPRQGYTSTNNQGQIRHLPFGKLYWDEGEGVYRRSVSHISI